MATEEYGAIPKDSDGMLLDGVACSSCIDSSGESVLVEGVDCSQMDEDARIMLNYEHYSADKSDKDDSLEGAGALVGQVVYLKKIFTQDDVEGERQQEYFEKCKKNPLIYVVARLYDGSGHENAIALAATIRDNAKHHEPIAARFSIEGSTLKKVDNKIETSIFRRLALTFKPANKTAISGLLLDPNSEKATGKASELKVTKSEVNPLYRPIGGSVEIECDPCLVVLEKADGAGFFEKSKEWVKGLESRHHKSLAFYKQKGFRPINSGLRKGNLLPEHEEHVKNLDEAISKSTIPQSIFVYRHTKLPKLPGIGQIVRDKGFCSTSLYKDRAFESGLFVSKKPNFLARIKVPKGSAGAYIDHDEVHDYIDSGTPQEHEVLLPRGSNFRVLGVKNDPDSKTTLWDLELVPGEGLVGGKVSKSDSIQESLGDEKDGSDRFVWEPGELEVVGGGQVDRVSSLLSHVAVLHDLAKATTAGSMDAAPSTLTGGAALQRECFLGNKKNQLLAKIRDTSKPFSKEELRAFVRAELPGVSEEFLNHFEGISNDYRLKKSQLNKKESPLKLEPTEVNPSNKVPTSKSTYSVKGKSGLYRDSLKGPVLARGSIWNHVKQKSLLAPIKANVKRAYFDEKTGTLHTHFGSFKAQAIPHQTGSEDAAAFDKLLNHPNLQKVMDCALPNWHKVHLLAGARQLPDEIPMHSAMFSIMSANNPVPINELQFSRMVDVMKKTGLDPRKPGFEAIAEHMKAADSPDVLPEHSQDHFKGNPGMFAGKVTTGPQVDLFGNRVKERPEGKRNIGEINSISPFMYNKFIPMLSEYHKVHDRVIKAFKKHGNSMIDLGGALKDLVPGLGVKTGLFAAGMAGGGNAVVPDTHHIRRTFGFHLHNDADTIKKVKDEMWDPENYQNTMRPYARWFAKNNPAVQHLLKNPKFAHMFKGHEEDAAFPGFWLDWQAIQPWEKMKGLPTLSNTGTATHKPVWDAFSQFAKSETDNLDSTLPLRTALVHRKYEENYGEMPATFLYYANVVPKLLEAAEHRKKFEAGLSFLAKSREIEAELVELKKTVRETLEGSRVPMPEVYRVDIKHGDKTNPAGRYMIHNGKISHLEDYHGVLDAVLPEGPINADAIAKLHGLKLSNNFQVRQHEPKENEEPQEVRARLPQVDVSLAPTPKRPPVFEYFRPGLQKPHVVEFSKEGAALDGQKLDQRELALMLENANQGLASIKWKKSEEPLNKAERLMAPTEALQQIRELVSKGLVHPDIERSLTQHIYADPMTGVGNKLAYREFRDQNRPGVWASIDLNSFKHVNDTYGHDTGDDAIKAVGGALREAGRKVGTGKMWRPGGDEFVSWHPSYEEASQFVRHAKNHVDALPPVNGVHRHSFSVGLGNDFKTADKALLLAKKQKFDPETKQLRFLPGKTPHLGHSLVPGTEGPLPLESEAPPQHVLPKGQPQLSP